MRPSSGVTFNMILISTEGIDLQKRDLNREVLFTQRFENRSVSGHSQASTLLKTRLKMLLLDAFILVDETT